MSPLLEGNAAFTYFKSLARISQRVALHGFIVLTCIGVAGCVVVKVPKRTVGADGNTERAVDLTFLTAGATHRSEIENKLGWLDTGFKNQQLFWGRFIISTWKAVGLLQYQVLGDRMWYGRNLMIELDENGITTHWEILEDKHLGRWLQTWATRTKQPPVNFASPTGCPTAEVPGFTPSSGPDWVVVQIDCRQIK